MTFEEWVQRYEVRSGDKHIVPDGYTTLYDKEKGYAQYKVENNRLWIYETCGDGKYWFNLGAKICQDHNIPYLCTICTVKIFPYIRLMGGKITSKKQQPDRDGGWKIEGVNHMGLSFYAWPAWFDHEKGRHAYYVVSEVK